MLNSSSASWEALTHQWSCFFNCSVASSQAARAVSPHLRCSLSVRREADEANSGKKRSDYFTVTWSWDHHQWWSLDGSIQLLLVVAAATAAAWLAVSRTSSTASNLAQPSWSSASSPLFYYTALSSPHLTNNTIKKLSVTYLVFEILVLLFEFWVLYLDLLMLSLLLESTFVSRFAVLLKSICNSNVSSMWFICDFGSSRKLKEKLMME